MADTHRDDPANPNDLAGRYQQNTFIPKLNFTDRNTSYKPLVDEDFRQHVRSVSLSTFSTNSSLKRAPPGRGAISKRVDVWWVFDSLCLLTSVVCTVIIIALLAIHDGKSMESWTFYFSLNTVVSTLGTVVRSSLVAAVSSSLAQGKWLWFKKRRSDLTDFDLLDSASRGSWGSFKLLARADVRHLVALGALVTISSLAVGPMLQSAIDYPGRPSNVLSSKSVPATIGQALSLDGGIEYDHSQIHQLPVDGNVFAASTSTPDFGIVAAINNGFAEVVSSPPPFTCLTGNCTWPIFASMAVCTSCYDVSSLLKKSSGDKPSFYDDVITAPGNGDLPTQAGNGTMYSIGTGNNSFHINNMNGPLGAYGEYMTAKGYTSPNNTFNYKDMQSLLFSVVMLRADDRYRNGGIKWEDTTVTATECALYMCINAYDSSTTNGQLKEKVVGTWSERTPMSWLPQKVQPVEVVINNTNSVYLGTPNWSPIGLAIGNTSYVNRTDYQLSIPSQLARKLKIRAQPFNATQRFLVSTGQYLSSLLPETMGQVMTGITGGDRSQLQYTDNIMQPLYESRNLTATFEQLAESMTSRFRSSSKDFTSGTLHQWTTFFRIRWGFLVLPVAVIVGGSVFMFASIFETRKWKIEPWRASELASLIYGLDERTRLQLRRACSGNDMEAEAGRIRVQLLDGAEGPELR